MSGWGYRVCCGCGQNLRSDNYSSNQWNKAVGVSRCNICVQENIRECGSGFNTARMNHGTRANFDHYPFEEGTFRLVYRGVYTGGARTGQKCVKKIFKNRTDLNEDFYSRDLDAVEKTLKILVQWNQSGIINKSIRLNKPEIWDCPESSDKKCMVEPFIEEYQKFNSNSGWTDGSYSTWSKIMQALSHYSYHISSGQFTLCDLQGGVNQQGAILTDPAVHSQNRRYGITDLGKEGICSFFHGHECNEYCSSSWTKPRDTIQYFPCTQRTTMAGMRGCCDDDDDDDDY